MVPAIGCALHLSGSDGPDALDVVAVIWADFSSCWCWTNFEHLLSAAADVALAVLGVDGAGVQPLSVAGPRRAQVRGQPARSAFRSRHVRDELNASPSGAFAPVCPINAQSRSTAPGKYLLAWQSTGSTPGR